MRSRREHELVAKWIAQGANDCEISRVTGIPRTTVRDWRRRTTQPGSGFTQRSTNNCPICDETALDGSSYCYLLGLYLGDGTISSCARGVYSLRVTLDRRYPDIIDECVA